MEVHESGVILTTDVNGEKIIQTGTIESLLNYLLGEEENIRFTNEFILTYTLVMTTRELLERLYSRIHLLPEYDKHTLDRFNSIEL